MRPSKPGDKNGAGGQPSLDGQRPPLFDPDGQFSRNYNRYHFEFQHLLKGHPLFELPSLIELSRRPYHRDPIWANGSVSDGKMQRLSLQDTIANIADNDSQVFLRHLEQDPVYASALQEVLGRVVEVCGEEMRQDVAAGQAIIVIASPNRVTLFHMDFQCNFLFQIVGHKTLSVFDQTDRTLISHEERERYCARVQNSIVYKESRQSEATAYELGAGDGVHIPVFAPHWARNYDNISIALSINYELHSVRKQMQIYKMNFLMRKSGITPIAPGIWPWRDKLKLSAANTLLAARRFVKGRPVFFWRPTYLP